MLIAGYYRMSQTEIKVIQPRNFKKLSERNNGGEAGAAAAAAKNDKKGNFTVQSVVSQLQGSKSLYIE